MTNNLTLELFPQWTGESILDHLITTPKYVIGEMYESVSWDCHSGQCGLCMVLSDSAPCLSCITPFHQGIGNLELFPCSPYSLSYEEEIKQLLSSPEYQESSELVRKKIWEIRLAQINGFRVNIIKDQVFACDTPEQYINNKAVGVYPYTDEAILLSQWFQSQGITFQDVALVDPFVGCGHLLLSIPWAGSRVGIDKNRRALIFFHTNSFINSSISTGCLGDSSDPNIWRGLASSYTKMVVVGNPPMSPWPFGNTSDSLSWHGGYDGLDRTVECISAAMSSGADVSFALLCYSLSSDVKVRVLERLKTKGLTGFSWHSFHDIPMWRVGQEKVCLSPLQIKDVTKHVKRMPGNTIPLSKAVSAWKNWSNHWANQAYTRIEYGIVTNLN